MKNLNLAVLVSSAVLILSGVASAEDTYKNQHHQNLSKRPYSQPLPDSAYQKSSEFEGATLVRGELSEQETTADQHQKMMRMNQLSKRPY